VNRAWLHPFPDAMPEGLEGEVLAWYKSSAIRIGLRSGSCARRTGISSRYSGFLGTGEDVDGLQALEKLAVQMHLGGRLRLGVGMRWAKL